MVREAETAAADPETAMGIAVTVAPEAVPLAMSLNPGVQRENGGVVQVFFRTFL